jgi:hypothetical protein
VAPIAEKRWCALVASIDSRNKLRSGCVVLDRISPGATTYSGPRNAPFQAVETKKRRLSDRGSQPKCADSSAKLGCLDRGRLHCFVRRARLEVVEEWMVGRRKFRIEEAGFSGSPRFGFTVHFTVHFSIRRHASRQNGWTV